MSDRSFFSKYGEYLSLGAEIAAAVLLPILLGYWADSLLDTSPWLILAGSVLGIINVVLLLVRLGRKLNGKK